MMGRRAQKIMNLWVAYFMPLIMVGLAAYGTWVFAVLVCVKYILIERKQTRTAIALLTVYFILFSFLAIAYFRIVLTVNLNPGYLPKGPKADKKLRGSQRDSEEQEEDMENGFGGQPVPEVPTADDYRDTQARPTTATDTAMLEVLESGPPLPPVVPSRQQNGTPGPTPTSAMLLNPRASRPNNTQTNGNIKSASSDFDIEGLRKFLNKDVYVCQGDGLPRWCGTCKCWKPDRSHHCSEVERCVWKMDHFCPWVGGVVAETSYRYFYQVVFWGLFYCLFAMISMAVYINRRSKNGDGLNSAWIACVSLMAVFGFFCVGMVYSTTQFIYRNQSTIDAIQASDKVYTLAIRDPNPPQPDPAEYRRVWLPPAAVAPQETRTCFVLVNTKPGENPWLLDSKFDNFREALGGSVLMWFLPWGIPKPGTTGGEKGFYKWNERIISRLKKEAGVAVYSEK